MVYVDLYAQRDEKGYSISKAKTFRSLKKMLDYCYDEMKANYVVIEQSADSSFDYIVHCRQFVWG